MIAEYLGPTIKATASSGASTEMYRAIDSVRQGATSGSIYMTLPLMFAQVNYAMDHLNYAFRYCNRAPVSKWIWIPLTILLEASTFALMRSKHFQPIGYFLYEHMDSVIQVASVVTSIALFILGAHVYATVSLVFLSIGFLDRKGLLPSKVEKVYHKLSPLLIVTGSFYGGLFTRIFGIAAAILVLLKLFGFSVRDKVFELKDEGKTKVDIDLFHRIASGRGRFKVNRGHVKYLEKPTVPKDVKFDELIDIFRSIDWKKKSTHMVVCAKLKDDARWKKYLRDRKCEDVSMDEKINYLQKQLQELVRTVKEHKIHRGAPIDYKFLEDVLKIEIQDLRKECAVSKEDRLLRLAIEGGDYCGPGIFRILHDEYLSIISNDPGLEVRILAYLERIRERKFQALFLHNEHSKMGEITTDAHFSNRMITVFGKNIGVWSTGADNDSAINFDEDSQILIPLLLKRAFNPDRDWWGGMSSCHSREEGRGAAYDPDAILEELSEASGTHELPLDYVIDWWRKWIERQNISQSKQKELLEELSTRVTLFGYPLTRTKIRNEKEITQMNGLGLIPVLLEAGILVSGSLQHSL